MHLSEADAPRVLWKAFAVSSFFFGLMLYVLNTRHRIADYLPLYISLPAGTAVGAALLALVFVGIVMPYRILDLDLSTPLSGSLIFLTKFSTSLFIGATLILALQLLPVYPLLVPECATLISLSFALLVTNGYLWPQVREELARLHPVILKVRTSVFPASLHQGAVMWPRLSHLGRSVYICMIVAALVLSAYLAEAQNALTLKIEEQGNSHWEEATTI